MFNDQEMEMLFRAMFERMLKAGWLKKFRFTKGKGWWLVWTVEGGIKAAQLKEIARRYGLMEDDRNPHALTVIAYGLQPTGLRRSIVLEPATAIFWRQCGDELGLSSGSEDHWLILVHTVLSWAPDEGTQLEF